MVPLGCRPVKKKHLITQYSPTGQLTGYLQIHFVYTIDTDPLGYGLVCHYKSFCSQYCYIDF